MVSDGYFRRNRLAPWPRYGRSRAFRQHAATRQDVAPLAYSLVPSPWRWVFVTSALKLPRWLHRTVSSGSTLAVQESVIMVVRYQLRPFLLLQQVCASGDMVTGLRGS